MMEEAMRVRKRRLRIVFPNAAGIDVGAAKHHVAVPAERWPDPVREFDAFTPDLIALAEWLAQCEVDTVVLESTGVYWIPLYELLESRGFTVYLVNAKHVKNVPGKKSDVLDCQWLQQVMSFGLLSRAFRPPEEVCALRAVVRQRDTLVEAQAQQIQRMQKALAQMNVQLTNVISDIAGHTGQAIIRAIVGGERDPHRLAQLRNYRVHASEEQIARSLMGNWREEHIFCLAQALTLFDTHRELIEEADKCIEAMLMRMQGRALEALPPNKNKGRTKNAPGFDARTALYRWAGVDLTRIGGIDVSTALKIVAELGVDLSKFKSAKHFASWLGLCPGTRITGGKRISGATKRIPNRVSQALKLAASGLHRSRCALGAYYRRLAARLGAGKAITATAHKLARLVYAILTKGEEFVQRSQDYYEERVRVRTIRHLQKKAASLGFTLQPNAAV
jgi:transposase